MTKLPFPLLEKYVFNRTGVSDPDVLVGPALGEDASIVKLDGKVLVAHADPIVGAIKDIGWLAVHIACNDIAVHGVRPRWIIPVILLQEGYSEENVNEITSDIDRAAREVGVMIIGGHTGFAVGLERPLITVTAMGIAPEGGYVLTGGAQAGDYVVLTKGAGIEGTAIIAFDFEDVLKEHNVSEEIIEEARKLMYEISVLKDSLALAQAGATSIHDATRGGVLEALIEIALSSHVKIEVWEEKIPLRNPTKIFAERLRFDPLKLISSGTVVATVPRGRIGEAERNLAELNIPHITIGEIVEGNGVTLHRMDGRVEEYHDPKVEEDELARVWELYPRR